MRSDVSGRARTLCGRLKSIPDSLWVAFICGVFAVQVLSSLSDKSPTFDEPKRLSNRVTSACCAFTGLSFGLPILVRIPSRLRLPARLAFGAAECITRPHEMLTTVRKRCKIAPSLALTGELTCPS